MEHVSLLGDSQVRRMIKTLTKLGPNHPRERDYAISGLRSDNLKTIVRECSSDFHKVCFILVGINDILKGYPIASIKQNIKSTINILVRDNKTVLISTLPPILYANEPVGNDIKILNIFIQSLQRAHSVIVIKLHKHFSPFIVTDMTLFQQYYKDNKPDNVHLSADGHLLLIGLITRNVRDNNLHSTA